MAATTLILARQHLRLAPRGAPPASRLMAVGRHCGSRADRGCRLAPASTTPAIGGPIVGATTVVGNPGHPVRVDGRRVEGPDADWIHLPDPIAEAIQALSSRIATLERMVAELSDT